jgi:hypothetical protein
VFSKSELEVNIEESENIGLLPNSLDAINAREAVKVPVGPNKSLAEKVAEDVNEDVSSN